MSSIQIYLIYATLLTMGLLAQNVEQRKLVCSQSDGTIEAPKGYCSLVNGNCSCTEDCTENLSLSTCICTRTDLTYAQDQQLANCSIWTQQAWSDYVRNSRQNSTNVDLPPPASNTPDGNYLSFSTSDGGLAWPITDGRDMGNLLIHGPHCFEMVKMFNEQVSKGQPLDNIYDRLHSAHCRRLVRRVLYYYENVEKNYQVQPPSLCRDFHTSHYTTSRSSEHHRTADKNKYRRQLDENTLAEKIEDEGLDYGSGGIRLRYGRELTEQPHVATPNDDKNKYKHKYGRRSAEDTPAEKPEDEGLDYGSGGIRLRYGRELTEQPHVATPNDDKNKYKHKYGRRSAEDTPAEKPEDEGLDYGSGGIRLRYGRELTEQPHVATPNDDKNKYKHKYGRQLTDQIHAATYDDDRLSYPFRYEKSISVNSNQANVSVTSRSVYDRIYADAKKGGSKKPSQQRLFDTISGQNLGDLLVKEWMELPLTNAERDFLAVWESELVVRTAALGIYCVQGHAEHAPITEIRDVLLMQPK